MRRATAGLESGADVVVVVRGPIGANVGAGRLIGAELSDARTIEVEAGGRGAAHFAAELKQATTLYSDAWTEVA